MPLAPDIVAGVSRRLAEHAGLELPTWVVEARTSARIAALHVTPEDYVELIATARGSAELGELVEAVRVGESSLFRHKQQIAAVVDAVIPALRAQGRRTVRVWSAGCASGEEPYTLAAVLARELPSHTISIIATDVSADALERAAQAQYPIAELADVPDEFRDAFVADGAHVRVRPEIAKLVTFEQANLNEASPPRGCDLVWCRNVLIYFTAAARRRVIDRLVAATSPGGYVFVGYSETLRDVAELETCRAGDAVFYQRRGGAAEMMRTPVVGVPVLRPSRPPAALTPPTGLPVTAPPAPAPTDPVLVLRGSPEPEEVTAAINKHLTGGGIVRLTIDLDSAELLVDELAPVLRRARAAGVVLRATRTGAKRWVSRHRLDEVVP